MKSVAVLAALVLALASHAGHAQKLGGGTTKSTAALALFDATGKQVGRLSEEKVVTTLASKQVWLTVRVQEDDDTKVVWFDVPLYFATADCTGQAYASPNRAIGATVGAIAKTADGKYFAYLPVGSAITTNLISLYARGICYQSGLLESGVPVSAPIDLSALFPLPMTLQ